MLRKQDKEIENANASTGAGADGLEHLANVHGVSTIKEEDTDKYNVGDIDICNAASTTDLTGLIPRPPQNDYETESFHDIYTFGPPEI